MRPVEQQLAELRAAQRTTRGLIGGFIVAVLAAIVVGAPIAMAGGLDTGGGLKKGGGVTGQDIVVNSVSFSATDARSNIKRVSANVIGSGGSFRTGVDAQGSGAADLTVFGDFYAGLSAGFSVAYNTRDLNSDGSIHTTSTKTAGSCTLNAGSPSTCTATVVSGAKCGCFATGTAAGAVAYAASVTTTTLTCTGPNAANSVVNYLCI